MCMPPSHSGNNVGGSGYTCSWSLDILTFKQFQTNWEFIDQSTYDIITSDEALTQSGSGVASQIIKFAKRQLEQFQPQDDYRELLKLTITFLGGVPARGVSFRMPAELHRAKWMAKSIYSLKIWMLERQFKLSKREQNGIADICLFTVKLYVTAWYQAPYALFAARLDLQLLKNIMEYKALNTAVADVALKKFLSHLWYL